MHVYIIASSIILKRGGKDPKVNEVWYVRPQTQALAVQSAKFEKWFLPRNRKWFEVFCYTNTAAQVVLLNPKLK